jgi:sugar lactone lactonase YvrE
MFSIFRKCALAALALYFVAPLSAPAADDYVLGPDSKPQPGVPRGELIKFDFAGSKIFPGTSREVTIYVPRQYAPAKPACVYVNQDGVQWNAPTVFDNLIARAELPVIIGVFVRPGVVPTADRTAALDRFNRSFEYDGLGDAYARFLLEEILPAVETKTTADGRAIRLSHSGNDRAIGGSSSGAIAAFTAAWERPDAFSRVFSAIGTYVGLRGGDRYPTLIRKYEPKPLRIFLQDGANDNNHYGGDWWMANQTMERALTFAGYDVRHAWGDGAHSGKHGSMLFPEAIRWLWQDWPQPVKAAAPSKNATLAALLIPGEEWQLVGEGYRLGGGPATDARGDLFFSDQATGKIYRVGGDGRAVEFIADWRKNGGLAFGPDGWLFSVSGELEQILSYGPAAPAKLVTEGIKGHDLVVAHNGNTYVTAPPAAKNEPSQIWLVRADGTKLVVDTGVGFAAGIALSPDQTLLYVADHSSHWVYSHQVQADGALAHKQRYYWLHEADADDQSYADGLTVDRDGRLYAATRLGIQVCDQAGRVQCILPTPNGRVSHPAFGGPDFATLYAMAGDKVYKRRLHTAGANAWAAPTKPAAPKL